MDDHTKKCMESFMSDSTSFAESAYSFKESQKIIDAVDNYFEYKASYNDPNYVAWNNRKPVYREIVKAAQNIQDAASEKNQELVWQIAEAVTSLDYTDLKKIQEMMNHAIARANLKVAN